MFKRVGVFVYGAVSYLIFFATFLYAMGFVGNWMVPKSIDSGAEAPFLTALLINAGLLGLFAVQHSVMARQWFKAAIKRFIPEEAERSTYVLMSSLALLLLFREWVPMGGIVWDVQNQAARLVMTGLFLFGWLLVLVTTFLINHFDLFGLRQVYLYLVGREYTPLVFRTPGPYKLVRHPLYVGWFFAFWAAPTMTAAHFFFAVCTAAYILIAIQLEERDLVAMHGERYRRYQREVPMLVPGLARSADDDSEVAPTREAV